MRIKKGSKQDREQEVLLGLIDLYLKEGRPVGSHTLQDKGFKHLSSATIRNYFARLESEGYLKQHHTSGGRVPTASAYRIYAESKLDAPELNKDDSLFLSSLLLKETRELSTYFQEAVEAMSELSGCAAFIAAPRFDQDFIVKVRLVHVDDKRALCVLVTDFSLIHTEVLYLPKKLSTFSLKRVEEYFQYRLTGQDRPVMEAEVEEFAKQAYNEIVLRHFVSYTNNQKEDIYKAGFSKLLLHPEFHDPEMLANTLSLFERSESVRKLLGEAFTKNEMLYWVGDDLQSYIAPPFFSAMVAMPYYIHQKPVGAIAILGPDRLAYAKVFGLLAQVSEYLSENLTKSMYKFKLHYRTPQSPHIDMAEGNASVIGLTYQSLTEKTDE